MTYVSTLVFALAIGIGSYVATAAGRHATATSAIPYALGAAAGVAFFGCAVVAYRKGQPNKR
jgi:hypothetical protein